MDTITHALSGALLARATAPAGGGRLTTRARLVSGALTAAFPDSDFIIRFFTDPLTYLNLHRGITHSLVMLPLWAVLLSMLYAAFSRGRYHWRDFVWITAACLAIHIAGDVITVYGTKVLAPFSDWKAIIANTFILDLWVTGILVAGLLASRLLRPARLVAGGAFLVLIGYISFQGHLRGEVTALATAAARQAGINYHRLVVMPQPLSPFNWKVVAVNDREYHVAYLNLRRREPVTAAPQAGFFERIDALYQPRDRWRWQRSARFGEDPGQAKLAEQVWHMKGFDNFKRFAMLPVVYRVKQHSEGLCVWFTDLRFVIGEQMPPFRFGMCQEHGEPHWKLRRLPRNSD